MRYSPEEEDRALSRLLDDIKRHPDTKQPRTYGGVGFAFMLLSLLLALWLLLAVGCVSVVSDGDYARRVHAHQDGKGLHLAEPRQP